MPKLSDTQAVMLAAAAARPDLSLLPIPDTIRLKGSALERSLQALGNRGLVTDAPADGKTRRSKWTVNRLVITPAGLAAIGVEVAEGVTSRSKATEETKPATPRTRHPERPGGKLGVLLDAVAGPTGATLDELTTVSGWLPHTTRAALTRLRQRGFDVRLATTDGRKAYHLVPAA